jgi:hypothetical protein
MSQIIKLSEIDQKIKSLKNIAELLKEKSKSIPAIQKNTTRILASIKMLEINVSDILDLEIKK